MYRVISVVVIRPLYLTLDEHCGGEDLKGASTINDHAQKIDR